MEVRCSYTRPSWPCVTFNDKWHGFFSAIWHSQGDPDHRHAGRVPSCFDRVGELLLDVGASVSLLSCYPEVDRSRVVE